MEVGKEVMMENLVFIENFEMSDQLLKLESLNREVIST